MAKARETVRLAQPLVAGGGAIIASPFQFLLTGEDNLRIVSWGRAAGLELTIRGRFLPTGETQIASFLNTHTPASNGALRVQYYPLGDGVLLNLVVRPSTAAVLHGSCFVRVDLVRGIDGAVTQLGTLLRGYVDVSGGLAWPNSPLTAPSEGAGVITVAQGAVPAAGADPVLTMPAETRWRIIGVRGVLTTAAGGANRVPTLFLQQTTLDGFAAESSLNQAPGAVGGHSWGPGATPATTAPVLNGGGPLPVPAMLETGGVANSSIRTVTVNLAAGDQWTALTAIVEQWLNPVADILS